MAAFKNVSDSIKRTVRSASGNNASPQPDHSGVSLPRNTHETLSLIEAYLNQLKVESPGKQVAVGSAAGFVIGYVSGKLGRSVIRTIGLTFLIIHLGERQGYISVDWDRLKGDSAGITEGVRETSSSWFSRIKNCLKDQYLTATGLTAGLLLGLGTS